MKLPPHIVSPNPDIYHGGNYVVLDFETTTQGKGLALYPDNRIVLACWSVGVNHPARGAYHDRVQREWLGEYELARLVKDCEDADFIVAHNCKFELAWLARCGLDLSRTIVWDTMLGDYVIGGNRWCGHMLSLANCAKRRKIGGKMDIITQFFKAGVSTWDIPASWLETYCVNDVTLCERLFAEQQKDMSADPALFAVMYTRCLLTPVLADMEGNGMRLDADLIRIRLAKVEKEYAETQRQLAKITGGINTNSGKQLAAYLYGGRADGDSDGEGGLGFAELRKRQGGIMQPVRTEKGQPKTDAATVQALKCTTKEQRAFIKVYTRDKELSNELTKYLRKFADCVANSGGVLRGQFNQSTTQTHRLSSSGLDYSTQFQNFPRVYKPMFRAAADGWIVGEADGAQLEFRVAVHLGRDDVGISDIENKVDVHSVSAKTIGLTRQEAKSRTFKPLYGGTSGTKAEQRYYKLFREKYSGITRTQQGWIDEVLSNGSLRTPWGLRYYWPNTRMDPSGYVTNTTAICNYPVQAFATAEIIPIALVYFWHRLRVSGLQMRIVNTVHDSIIVELPVEEVAEYHKLCRQSMIDDVYNYLDQVYAIKLVVPLGCGVKVATHWGGDDASEYVPEGIEHDKGEVLYTAAPELVAAITEERKAI